jgi:hypothetical protein
MLDLSSLVCRAFVAVLVLFVHAAPPAQAQEEDRGPTVTVQVQLQLPPGVPAGGIPITVIPVGTIEYASVRSVSNDSGLVSFHVPLAWFPPDANPPSLGAHIIVNDFGTRGGRQVAETIVARSEIGVITGPFRADTPVSATIALAPSATASGNVTVIGPQRFDVSFDDRDIISQWLNYPKLINGKWNIAGLPRVPKLTLMFASDSCERIVTLDLSAGTADWGTVVLPQPQGSSRLRLKILGVPESVPASSALLLSLSTGVSYIASTPQRDGILLGRPEDAAGIALPPGQYAVLVDGLHLDETIAFYKKYSRDQQPIDPTKVPIITLVDGQTSEIELSWAEWRPKLLEYSPALTDRGIAAILDPVTGGGAPQNSRPRLYIPPGMLPNIPTVRPPPASTTPAPTPPSKP